MTDQPNNPSAFPCQQLGSDGLPAHEGDPGMSLRDYIATHVLAGMLAHSRGNPPHGYRPADRHQHWHDAISEEAYDLADAMLAERGRYR